MKATDVLERCRAGAAEVQQLNQRLNRLLSCGADPATIERDVLKCRHSLTNVRGGWMQKSWQLPHCGHAARPGVLHPLSLLCHGAESRQHLDGAAYRGADI